MYFAKLGFLVRFLGFQYLLLTLLFDLFHPFAHRGRILFVKEWVTASRHRLFKLMRFVFVAARDFLSDYLRDLIETGIHSLTIFLGTFYSFTDLLFPALVILVLSWGRYRLLYPADLLCARYFGLIADFAFGAATARVDVTLHPVGVLSVLVLSGAGHGLLLLGVLVEEGKVLGFLFQGVTVSNFQFGTSRFTLWCYVGFHGEVGLVLVGPHVCKTECVTRSLYSAVAGATAHFPASDRLCRVVRSLPVKVNILS